MASCILMQVTMTGKGCHPDDKWAMYHYYEKRFDVMQDARNYLKDEYYYCKTRKPMYVDTRSRGTIQCGWIYCMKVKEEGKTHYEQHWVSLFEESRQAIKLR